MSSPSRVPYPSASYPPGRRQAERLFAQAVRHHMAGAAADAAAAYRQVLAADPAMAEAHNNLGVLLRETEPDAALAAFTEATRLRPAYAAKAHALASGLRSHCAGLLTFSEPQGGMFIWARLDARLPALGAQAWAGFGLEHRVLVVPGNAFSITPAPQALLRLSFANPAAFDLQEGAARLGRGLQVLASHPAPSHTLAA